MVEVNDLKQLYKDVCMSEYSDICVVKESDPDTKVKQVNFKSKQGIVFCDKILNEFKNGFQSISYCLALQKNCDGLILTEFEGQKYLIWVELKSGYNDVAKKAVLQIASSYLKHKFFLSCFNTFDSSEYREFGIIISNYPKLNNKEQDKKEGKQEFVGNDRGDRKVVKRMQEIRVVEDPTLKNYGNVDSLEKNYVEPLFRDKFRHGRNDFIILKGEDFGYQHIRNIKPELILKSMPVVHISTNESESTFDLEYIIKRVIDFKNNHKEGLFA